MARAPKLKVFRTPIGFHDAYVAAPSQKAAVEAWGSDKSLFARGEAEEVTDPALTAAPLAAPGVVVKRLRGSAAEQIAALGQDEEPGPRARGAGRAKGAKAKPAKAPPKPKPRPSRAALDEAEAALAAAAERHREERKGLSEREAALARERRELEAAQAKESERLSRARDTAEARYEAAMRRWRG
jgi:hypothetical protein